MDRLVIAPPYSQVFLTDAGDERFPPEFSELPVQARPRGLRIATLMWQDGSTTIDVAVDEALDLPDGATLAFEGEIATPTEELMLYDPERQVYWRRSIDAFRVTARVWANHPTEPDYVGVELRRRVTLRDAD
jgi:hypothetical protein